jgi:release factor glutamine methyltransferase
MAAPGFLRPGGHLLLEHGAEQGAAVRALCASAGLLQAGTIRDLAGLERVTTARAPVECPPSPPATRT